MSSQQEKLKAEGNALVQKQKFEQAATIYTKALELDSTSEAAAAIFSNRSLCNLNTKKYTEALQDAEKAISLRPTWFRGYQRAAAACEKLTNKDEEGLKHLEKSFELDEASKNDADFKEMKANFELNIVKQKAPSMTQDELKQVGNRFVQEQQHEKAIEAYTLAIEKDALCDEAAPILSNRSLCYYNIGKYKEAYEDAGFCCGIRPDWAKGFLRRATSSQKLEEWQIALESYDEYLKLDPKDEAGVKSNRNVVVKIIADVKKKEEAKKRELKQIELSLSQIKDPDQRLAKAYAELIKGADSFDIERMKIALKQPIVPRLDTPFFDVVLERGVIEKGFTPEGLSLAKKDCSFQEPYPEGVSLVAETFMKVLGNKAKWEKTPVSRQVEFLDFFLDVVEEQGFNGPTALMRFVLHNVCWYDPTSVKHKSIRKDLIITLFNRIETARLLFCGKSATSKDFATQMLYECCSNFDPRLGAAMGLDATSIDGRYFTDKDFSSDVCTQDMYECISMAIHHKADPNFDHFPNAQSGCGGYVLDAAINHLRSVKVVELLLRVGADVNGQSVMDQTLFEGTPDTAAPSKLRTRRRFSTPLSTAFSYYRPDLIRALLRFDAKLPREDLPNWFLNAFPPETNSLVKPQFPIALLEMFSVSFSRARANSITHEYLGLLFEEISNQNLSFVCPDANRRGFFTPFTLGVESSMNINTLEIMLKLKPELLRTMSIPRLGIGSAVSPLGMLLFFAENNPKTISIEHLCSVAKLLLEYGADFRNDPAQCMIDENVGAVGRSVSCEQFLELLMVHADNKKRLEVLKKAMLE